MTNKRIKIIIWIIYWMTLFSFCIIGAYRFPNVIQEQMDINNVEGPWIILAVFHLPGIYHFNLSLIIAIIIKIIKKIPNEIKRMFYYFPLITLLCSTFIMMICMRLIY